MKRRNRGRGRSLTHSLFRTEAVRACHTQWLGTVHIGRPISFTFVTVAAILVVAALIAFAYWGQIVRKATVHGVLMPVGGLLHITAPHSGVVSTVLVGEGDRVTAGQPLALLRNDRVIQKGDLSVLTANALRARRESLEREWDVSRQALRQQREHIAHNLKSLQLEVQQAQKELDTLRLKVTLAKKSFERQQELVQAGFVAAAHVQSQQEDLLELQLRELNAERNLQRLARDIQAAKAERNAAEIKAQTIAAQLDHTSALLDQEESENDHRHALTLVASQAGQVSVLPFSAGQSAHVGQTVVSLIPSTADGQPNALQAHLFAPSRSTGFVHPGQRVRLRIAAYPYRKFGVVVGEVASVSRSPIAPQDLPLGHMQALMTAAQSSEPLYKITVTLAPHSWAMSGKGTGLIAGMSVEADVRLDERKIWEWILDPLISPSP